MLRRAFSFVLCLGMLVSLGCGEEQTILIEGRECISDLARVNVDGQRLGCLLFSHKSSTLVATYRDDRRGGPFYLCKEMSPDTCAISLKKHAGLEGGKKETAVVMAFPPASFAAGKDSDAFLRECSRFFSPSSALVPSCYNAPGKSKADMRECWFVFRMKYQSDIDYMQCEPWQE